jgi:hypothetical protein
MAGGQLCVTVCAKRDVFVTQGWPSAMTKLQTRPHDIFIRKPYWRVRGEKHYKEAARVRIIAYLAGNKIRTTMSKDKSPSKSKDKKAPVKNLKEKRADKKVKKTAKKSSSAD